MKSHSSEMGQKRTFLSCYRATQYYNRWSFFINWHLKGLIYFPEHLFNSHDFSFQLRTWKESQEIYVFKYCYFDFHKDKVYKRNSTTDRLVWKCPRQTLIMLLNNHTFDTNQNTDKPLVIFRIYAKTFHRLHTNFFFFTATKYVHSNVTSVIAKKVGRTAMRKKSHALLGKAAVQSFFTKTRPISFTLKVVWLKRNARMDRASLKGAGKPKNGA